MSQEEDQYNFSLKKTKKKAKKKKKKRQLQTRPRYKRKEIKVRTGSAGKKADGVKDDINVDPIVLKVGDRLSSFEDLGGFAYTNGVIVQVDERSYTVEYIDEDMQETHQAKVRKSSIKPSNIATNVDTKPPERNTSTEEKQDSMLDEVKESEVTKVKNVLARRKAVTRNRWYSRSSETCSENLSMLSTRITTENCQRKSLRKPYLPILTSACYLVVMKRCLY